MRNIDLREAYEAVYESSEEMDTVIQFLLDEGFVETKEDGSLMVESMSQAWYNTICERIIDEGRAHKPGGAGDGKGQRPVGVGGFHGGVSGLGRDYKGDKVAGKKAADAQHAKDRKAAAKERAADRAAGIGKNPLEA